MARVAETIGASPAVKIFICNLMTQPGETDGYTARRHLEVVKRYAPEIHFDYVVANDRPISGEQAAAYAAEGAHQIGRHRRLLRAVARAARRQPRPRRFGHLLKPPTDRKPSHH